jgi:hypothetical protein
LRVIFGSRRETGVTCSLILHREVTDKYLEYADELGKLIRAGISGAVYTQTTDVEIEVNGLLTYDRKKIKMDLEKDQGC